MANYRVPISFGDVMTVEKFIAAAESRCLIDYDGFGHPARDGKTDPDIMIQPSLARKIPDDATHIEWFNR